ncbi:hypothetical protein [Phytoactinopolyspora mesophila]|uniref:Uncharacterized protein n=1 Tax=Phytoactinopolyspora mesophila TaxID=2650750 RepID=A0A7K3M5F2_9ACTN|nr:hypothetical protein [Phytoactinopolyspora mesophila]NDL57668.1 hypothetical protein [Phytoactinopolyspora mesophila]
MEHPRDLRVQKLTAYGAALAMLPYLLIKIVWTLDGLLGGGLDQGVWEDLNWAQVNGLTVVMAAVGITLALMLAQRWGTRVPTWMVALPAWIGMGFLVPVLTMVISTAPFQSAPEATDPGAELPTWEAVLIAVAFAGTGLGLAIAFPLYARRRWPEAFRGAMSDAPEGAGSTRQLQVVLARRAMTVVVLLGLVQAYWAVGGTVGLETDQLGLRDARWHITVANSAVWALIAAWGIWALTHRRTRLRFWVPSLLTWVSSGSLFAWGAWKGLFTAAVPPDVPEHPFALAAVNQLSTMAGVVIGLTLLLVLHDRRSHLDDRQCAVVVNR